jgi:hypothetical protein
VNTPTEDEFRQRYQDLPDAALLSLPRDDLVEPARVCYDQEIARRGLQAQSAARHQKPAAVFRMGNVLLRSWMVLSRHFPTFSLLTAGALLPQLLLDADIVDLGSGVAMLSQTILGTFAEAVVIFAAFQDLRGNRVSAGESITRGMTRFLPAILVSLVSSLIIVLGMFLLVIPGLVAAAAYAVVVPVCVVEHAATRRSLSRSIALTRGFRLQIFGVFAAYLIVELVVSGAIAMAFPAGPLAAIANWLWTVVTTAYSAVYAAILYHDLRAAKEGIGIDEIAAVFD